MTTLTASKTSFLSRYRMLTIVLILGVAFPFLIGFTDGQSPAAVIASEGGNAKFMMGLAVEIFILALFALSYDLVIGVTGLLSLGQMMFFATGAYGAGVMLKSFEWALPVTLLAVIVIGVVQALLFAVVIPRTGGALTFALVTLGFASVFAIIVESPELKDYTGSDVGLQGAAAAVPSWLNTTDSRFWLYLVVFAILAAAYLTFKRILESPTGAVLVATRDNPDRAQMLGYNIFWFQLFALVVSSITAAISGMLWAMHQPIVTPTVAGLGWMVTVLLMVIMGGIGTLSGAIVGAGTYRLLDFYLERWFGGTATLLLGIAFILIVLFLPYGIVGTWRERSARIKQGRKRLISLVTGRNESTQE
ncbi:MAG: branched-chain amino acid ABC transporter permease [Acidimicrobiia bacterium]|nr:branched-chain amino acid ABC transporter permease [Acidimicrobiia bacterium]